MLISRALRQRGGSALQTDGLNDWPDVVMIDGGKGQLSSVMEALRELDLHEDLNVCSLAKQREEVFLPGESQPSTVNRISSVWLCCVVSGTKPIVSRSASIVSNAGSG